MTAWSQLAQQLPASTNMATAGAQRWVLQQFAAGNIAPLEWETVQTFWSGYKATFLVSNQPRLGDSGDSVLPIVSAETAQKMADFGGYYLTTALLHDAIAEQGYLISYVDDVYADVADLSAGQMVANSRRIDQLAPPPGTLWTVGKGWKPHAWYNNPKASGLRNGENTGINYGAHTTHPARQHGPWPSVSLPQQLRVWQPPGGRGELFHSLRHTDISQKSQHFVQPTAIVREPDGTTYKTDVAELAAGELWHLVSSAGPMLSMRIPIDALNGALEPGHNVPSGGGGRVTPVGTAGASSARSGAIVVVGALGLGALLWYALG